MVSVSLSPGVICEHVFGRCPEGQYKDWLRQGKDPVVLRVQFIHLLYSLPEEVRVSLCVSHACKAMSLCLFAGRCAQVLHGFDLGACQVAFTGRRLLVTRKALRTLHSGVEVMDPLAAGHNYIQRTLKYADRLQLDVLVPGLTASMKAEVDLRLDGMVAAMLRERLPRQVVWVCATVASLPGGPRLVCREANPLDVLTSALGSGLHRLLAVAWAQRTLSRVLPLPLGVPFIDRFGSLSQRKTAQLCRAVILSAVRGVATLDFDSLIFPVPPLGFIMSKRRLLARVNDLLPAVDVLEPAVRSRAALL